MATGIELVLADHREVEALFATFRETADGSVAGRIFDALTAHDDGEQAALYPLAAEVLADADLLERSQLAHSQVKMLMEHARAQEGMPLVEAVTALQGAVELHVRDEEANLLPALEAACTPAQLDALGARWLQAKQRVG